VQIIDSHVHFWNPTQLRYAWLNDLPKLNRAFLTEHVPSQVNGWNVEGIVFIQADCAPEQGLDEVDWVTSLAEKDSRVRGIVAFAPLEQGNPVRPHLDALKRKRLVKGVRRLIQDEPLGFAVQPSFVEGVRLLAEYGLSFDICIRHAQLPDAIQLVEQCPDVHFVLDHVGKPNIKQGVFERWSAQMGELAKLPNVLCKLSGMVTEADVENWTTAALRPYVERVLEVFGIGRVMFGSDAPVLYLAGTYEQWVHALQELTRELSDKDKQKLWHDNAAVFYRL